mmetsp:Transcript_107687/g.303351  ORF Transcript_107687/g.303351 Transcript_107687/m.303351 type:complete len:86 (-) Transcript_107687:8-265(-)
MGTLRTDAALATASAALKTSDFLLAASRPERAKCVNMAAEDDHRRHTGRRQVTLVAGAPGWGKLSAATLAPRCWNRIRALRRHAS